MVGSSDSESTSGALDCVGSWGAVVGAEGALCVVLGAGGIFEVGISEAGLGDAKGRSG